MMSIQESTVISKATTVTPVVQIKTCKVASSKKTRLGGRGSPEPYEREQDKTKAGNSQVFRRSSSGLSTSKSIEKNCRKNELRDVKYKTLVSFGNNQFPECPNKIRLKDLKVPSTKGKKSYQCCEEVQNRKPKVFEQNEKKEFDDERLRAAIRKYVASRITRRSSDPLFGKNLRPQSELNLLTETSRYRQTKEDTVCNSNSKSCHDPCFRNKMDGLKAQLLAPKNLDSFLQEENQIDKDFLIGMAGTLIRCDALRGDALNSKSYENRKIIAEKFKTNKSLFYHNNIMKRGHSQNYQVNTPLGFNKRHNERKPYVFKTIDVNGHKMSMSKCEFNRPCPANHLNAVCRADRNLKLEACHTSNLLRDDYKPYKYKTMDLNQSRAHYTPRCINYKNKYNPVTNDIKLDQVTFKNHLTTRNHFNESTTPLMSSCNPKIWERYYAPGCSSRKEQKNQAYLNRAFIMDNFLNRPSCEDGPIRDCIDEKVAKLSEVDDFLNGPCYTTEDEPIRDYTNETIAKLSDDQTKHRFDRKDKPETIKEVTKSSSTVNEMVTRVDSLSKVQRINDANIIDEEYFQSTLEKGVCKDQTNNSVNIVDKDSFESARSSLSQDYGNCFTKSTRVTDAKLSNESKLEDTEDEFYDC